MIGYVDRVKELRAEFDLILENCELSELSKEDIVAEARRIEELLSDNN